ncbi:glycosyltransferase family 4 protein [Pseudolysinimonas kribbensis]|uniref:Glycosyl transferase n=1 Tax=Pseudolysinimonas kribbensis TaxID=433641 RepID=A0ABQ6K744_9MICO|nr:glycosyltransferase family 4 protein [Pseudolysinimonas kribbensis]GMA94607.1 glycosyl transferase [Pseudolysinimonas kribbensis]
MRIGILAPVAWRTPPRHYGPWERVAGLLAEGLVAAGEEVTLFATADSVTSATLDAVVPYGYAEDDELDGRVQEALHVGHAIARSGDFDLIHSHLDWLPLALSRSWRAPVVTTIHGFSGPRILPAYRAAQQVPSAAHYVAISDSDRSPELSYAATIHHGIDLSELTASAHAGDALMTLGRIHPDKGTADAIEIARRNGRPLIIAGIIHDQRYFDEEVAPHLDGEHVRYLGSIGPEERSRLLGSAAVLLHPIHFDEPFGLSVVEAMACGTPVIAYRRGSMREIIDQGVTGYVVDDLDAANAVVEPAARLDRIRIRGTAERRFAVDRMVRDYLEVYRRAVSRVPAGPAFRDRTGAGLSSGAERTHRAPER